MRESLDWTMMRFSLWLSRAVPCALTKRLRSANVSRHMHSYWY